MAAPVLSGPSCKSLPSGLALVTCGARSRPDVSWVPAAAGPASRYVDNVRGNDATGDGSQAKPWRTIAKAAAAATGGQTVYVLETGTPYAEFVALTRVASAAAPISLVGVPQAGSTKLPEWRAPDATDKPLLRYQGQYWVVRGFDFNKGGLLSPRAVVFDQSSNHNALLESELQGNYGHAVRVHGRNVWVHQNRSHGHARAPEASGDADAHGFFVAVGASNVLLSRNQAYDNTGDGFQCSGSEAGFDPALDPVDVTLEDNRFYANDENAVDIKSCHYVTVAGTDAVDGSKFFGYTPAPNAPGGVAVVVHFFASHVLVEKTRVWGSGGGIHVGTAEGPSHNVASVAVYRNLLFNITESGGSGGIGVRVGKVAGGVDVVHNTLDRVAGGIQVGTMSYTGNTVNASANVRVWNNIVRDPVKYAQRVDPAYAPGFDSRHNVYFKAGGPVSFQINGVPKSFAQWKSGTGQDNAGSAETDPLFVADPANNDYYTLPASYARDRAYPGITGACGNPFDVGFHETC